MLKLILVIWVVVFGVQVAEAGQRHYNAKIVYIKIIKANKIYKAPNLRIIKDPKARAYSSQAGIVISTGMLKRLNNVHELALVLGHELAHINLWHYRSQHENEYNADRVGARYARLAGYNVCKGAKLLLRFGHRDSQTHPSGYKRYKRICKT